MEYTGCWRIYEMETWDKDYFDEEVPAYIQINGDSGEFQFGLVCGQIDGGITKYVGEERYDFTFEGGEEYDSLSGRGWLKLKGKNQIDGEFIFHGGDRSKFSAKRKRLKKRA